MSSLDGLTERELKLTAAVYVRHGAASHLRKTGKLPDKDGGLWSVIPMRLIIEERGRDLTLTPDEQLVYDAILREDGQWDALWRVCRTEQLFASRWCMLTAEKTGKPRYNGRKSRVVLQLNEGSLQR
jgi:hypothetical protein